MRVSGSKQRVILSEADLEHREAKPTRRVAPWAAALAWCGSIGIATAIYLEWLPARSLFSPSAREAETSRPRVVPPRMSPNSFRQAREEPVLQAMPERQPVADPVREVTSGSTSAASGKQASVEVTEARQPNETGRVTRSRETPESTRVIRGSYHSDHTNWVGGW